MFEIRIANKTEYDTVRSFYHSLIDAIQTAEYKPCWEKDIYPSPEFLQSSIENGELYIGKSDGKIASCMVLNHQYNEGYKNINWSVNVDDDNLLVIHALGVHPIFSGQGIAKEMVKKAIQTAEENGIKTIRLDVREGNLPAEKVYKKMGFHYVDSRKMYYEDTGWTNFLLFEYMVK